MSGLWSAIDEITEYFNAMGRSLPPEQPRKLVKRTGPVLRLVAFDGNENSPDDYESDGTLILPERPADFPTETDWAEETGRLPFDEWDADDEAN